MEKYRKFADAKYGINPFLPITPKGVNKFFKYVSNFHKLKLMKIDHRISHHAPETSDRSDNSL